MSVVIPSCRDSHLVLDQVCFPLDPKTSRQAGWHSEQSVACQMSATNNFLPALIANSGGEQQALEIDKLITNLNYLGVGPV